MRCFECMRHERKLPPTPTLSQRTNLVDNPGKFWPAFLSRFKCLFLQQQQQRNRTFPRASKKHKSKDIPGGKLPPRNWHSVKKINDGCSKLEIESKLFKKNAEKCHFVLPENVCLLSYEMRSFLERVRKKRKASCNAAVIVNEPIADYSKYPSSLSLKIVVKY